MYSMVGVMQQVCIKKLSSTSTLNTNLINSISHLIIRVLVLSDQAGTALLQELIKDAKNQIRNGLIVGLVGLLFASFGFFSYATSMLGFSPAWLALGMAGAAMVIAAFYVMIRADRLVGKWKRQLGNVTSSAVKSPGAEPSTDQGDEYFDENYENWKNPFEEDKE
jgi:hypothetical protein